MGIDMNGYKVIYRNEVYNCINIALDLSGTAETGFAKPKFLEVIVINKDNLITIIRDEAWTFQFVKDIQKAVE